LLPASTLREAELVLCHPHFDSALATLGHGLDDFFQREPPMTEVIGDRGAFAMIAAGLAHQSRHGVTIAMIQNFVGQANLASPGRVRAYIAMLSRTGAVWRVDAGDDGRARPWRIGGRLIHGLERWLTVYVDAAAKLGVGNKTSADHLLPYLRRSVNAYSRQGAKLTAKFVDLEAFLDYKLGHLVLTALLRTSVKAKDTGESVTLSRKGMAKGLQVSRAHITMILARAENLGLLHRDPLGPTIELHGSAVQQGRLWVAHELAWVMRAAVADRRPVYKDR
jgi:hypothetical protein